MFTLYPLSLKIISHTFQAIIDCCLPYTLCFWRPSHTHSKQSLTVVYLIPFISEDHLTHSKHSLTVGLPYYIPLVSEDHLTHSKQSLTGVPFISVAKIPQLHQYDHSHHMLLSFCCLLIIYKTDSITFFIYIQIPNLTCQIPQLLYRCCFFLALFSSYPYLTIIPCLLFFSIKTKEYQIVQTL